MTVDDSGFDDWLASQIAAVEQTLLGGGASCELDRRRATPTGLKRAEGRYMVLRLARRLRERGQGLQPLHGEADKARSLLAGSGALAHDRQWQAYHEGVLEAAAQVLAHAQRCA